MIVETLSASSIKTFDTCPKKFWAECVKKFSVPTHPKTLRGSCLHHILEKTVNARLNTPLDLEACEPNFYIEEAIKKYGVDEEGKMDVLNLIRVAKDLGYLDNLSHVIGCEVSLKFENGGFKFKGFMDRLDIDGDVATIYDLKTSSRKIEDEIDQWQTVMYSVGVRNLYPKVERVKMCYVELRHCSSVRDLKVVEVPSGHGVEALLKVAKEIADCPDDSNPKPSALCRFCAHPNCKFKKIMGGR
jgi:RecB family exonuclease